MNHCVGETCLQVACNQRSVVLPTLVQQIKHLKHYLSSSFLCSLKCETQTGQICQVCKELFFRNLGRYFVLIYRRLFKCLKNT